jgi:tetratricopeptide (TPR) repeat protein
VEPRCGIDASPARCGHHRPSSPFRLFVASCLCLAAAVTAVSAHAQSNSDKARAYFEEGARAYRKANYKKAVELFRKAYDTDPRPELVYNIGQAYERLRDVPDALSSLREYLRLSPATADRQHVEAAIHDLETELSATGVQQVTIASRPTGAEVEIDGRSAGETPWTGELKPGRHRAVLRLAGHADTRRDFLLNGDRAIDIDVALLGAEPSAPGNARAAAPAPSPTPTPLAPERDQAGLSRVRPWTWAALGTGVAALGASLGFELARESAQSEARSATTQIAYRSAYDSMKSRQTTSRVLLGVGAAATAAGGVLLYLDLTRARPAETASARIGVGCISGACGATARGTF